MAFRVLVQEIFKILRHYVLRMSFFRLFFLIFFEGTAIFFPGEVGSKEGMSRERRVLERCGKKMIDGGLRVVVDRLDDDLIGNCHLI